MKIISGKLKGKNLITHKEAKYRPATSMLKEAIFSILASGKFINPNSGSSILKDAVILDMFGGAGNLAFEAVSRGAEKVIIIEKNQLHVDLLNRNVRNLGVEDQAIVIKGDALNLPTPAIETKCSIVFIDPPFNAKLVEPSIESLLNKNWLKNDSHLVIRTHHKDIYKMPDIFELIFSRDYGNSLLAIYQFKNNEE